MDRETLEREAARLGYKLVAINRIKQLNINLKLSEFMPRGVAQEYIDRYIKNLIIEELYTKMAEYNKIGIYQERYNKDMCYFELFFSLEVIVPNAPTRRRTSRESHFVPI